MVAILDAFHFDLSLATPFGRASDRNGTGEEKVQEKSHEPIADVQEGVSVDPSGQEAVAMDTTKEDAQLDEGQEEKDEEGEEKDEEGEEEEEEGQATDANVEEQNRLTAQRIHDNIVRTILPRLQAVLTKQVERCACLCMPVACVPPPHHSSRMQKLHM